VESCLVRRLDVSVADGGDAAALGVERVLLLVVPVDDLTPR
jgi:hypothetical protein